MDYYFVGDEGSLGSYTDPVDFDFGAHALAGFRNWLRSQYASLSALNRTWRSGFRDWDAIVPDTTDEARRCGIFPPWADHRTYMEVSFAHAYQVVREAVREGDPEGRIAISGTQVTTPWDGADWFRLDRVVDDFLSYDGGNQWDLHRSFAKPGSRVGFWTGYGRQGAAVEHEIWSAALQGVFFPNLFWSYSVVNPDLTWSRSGRDMGEAFRALRFGGIGKLLMESERLGRRDRSPLFHGFRPRRGDPRLPRARPEGRGRGCASLPGRPRRVGAGLTDLGLSFDFVASPQIEEGGLDPCRYRVFVMPFSLALSAREVSAIEAFARGGGIVIADRSPGLFDEHCAWHRAGALDALFGVSGPPPEKREPGGRRPAGTVSIGDGGKLWGLAGSALEGLRAFEPALEAAGATALVRAGGTSAVFARPVGPGWALCLNVLLDEYPRLRKGGYGGGAIRALLSTLLGHLGVRPGVEATAEGGGRPRPVRVARYRFGETEILGVLPEPLDAERGHGVDGVAVYDRATGEGEMEQVEISLPHEGDVVDVSSGKPLGRTNRIRASVAPGTALVLAINPRRETITIEGPTTAARGEHPRFVVSGSGSGKHLVRCHVQGPDGQDLPLYARNLLREEAAATFVLPTALDDAAGAYGLECADVASGASARVWVDLK